MKWLIALCMINGVLASVIAILNGLKSFEPENWHPFLKAIIATTVGALIGVAAKHGWRIQKAWEEKNDTK